MRPKVLCGLTTCGASLGAWIPAAPGLPRCIQRTNESALSAFTSRCAMSNANRIAALLATLLAGCPEARPRGQTEAR